MGAGTSLAPLVCSSCALFGSVSLSPMLGMRTWKCRVIQVTDQSYDFYFSFSKSAFSVVCLAAVGSLPGLHLQGTVAN